jgi:catechol 2,3-dioxygenase-like lactoylglutathione lyase family enzyme
MNSNENLLIKRLQHIGIPVTDIRNSEAFYGRLGFVNVMQAPFEHEGGMGLCTMVKQGDIILELYEMPESILETIRERKDGHIDHIAFDVSDIDATFLWLGEQGFTIVEESPVFLKFWKNGCRYFNVIGPDGERLEFNQIL